MSAPAPQLAYISHETFVADVLAVAERIEAEGWRPDFLVGIGRGGLVPAAYLSHRIAIPLLSVDISSGEPGFAGDLLDKLRRKLEAGQRILIVDDINDSGNTIASLRDALEADGARPDHVRVAVLVNNRRSRARAEYFSRGIDRDEDKRWFVFPWEAMSSPEVLEEEALEVPERLA
ncbi:MAG: phosphoribosyltransferase [Alphaproteobacteria bacterium]|nr:phosphoribosyltransferase [Alphaproteobacteria bacterium]MBV9370637.1 phosphoribosyltransferase [Alphaproteobacteria bacterium]MBV9899999.1 phosphoribosyltransferase [Alphaproteobacteria bacterium]